MHMLRDCLLLVQDRHSWPFTQHQSHGTFLASAETTSAHLGTWAHPIFSVFPLTFEPLFGHAAGALLSLLPSLTSLSPSSSVVISSSFRLSPCPQFSLIMT